MIIILVGEISVGVCVNNVLLPMCTYSSQFVYGLQREEVGVVGGGSGNPGVCWLVVNQDSQQRLYFTIIVTYIDYTLLLPVVISYY